MFKIVTLVILLLSLFSCTPQKNNTSNINPVHKLLSVTEYKETVYASWLGQIIGNTYGLCYEFKFIEKPGPDSFPYGYTWTLDTLKKYNGAFSDDDTDIEYIYLIQMEKNGIEPTYSQLSKAWQKHIKRKIWCANRAALTMMKAGYFPPITGMKEFNPHWCQIDPQLVNEIWAVTAPGMIDYVVDKSEFAARITSNSFGVEPTLHYAAMYSAAFFEKDIEKLIDIGISVLKDGSRFAKIVEEVKALYQKYPNNWQKSRKIIKDKYYGVKEYNKNVWPVIDANLNGAYGIMALLYGQGDFQKTLDYSCAFGMDADNQAATMCGLLGIVNGLDAIPQELLYPLADEDWEKPFNDNYKVITREELSAATLTDQAERMAAQGEKIILAKGGEITVKNGEKCYKINPDARYKEPFEFNPIPNLYAEVNQPFSFPLYAGGTNKINFSANGKLPEGIKIEDDKIIGTPKNPGEYVFEIIANNGRSKQSVTVNLIVHTTNLAPNSNEILFNKSAKETNISLINDGSIENTYYSIKSDSSRQIDYYGYKWKENQIISSLRYNNGMPQEFGGWFTSFNVEYLKDGEWIEVEDVDIDPKMNLDNTQWLKPSRMYYQIDFEPVKTRGIRIIGLSGGIKKDSANAYLGKQYYTSISELGVYTK
jgi:hypothetical protein